MNLTDQVVDFIKNATKTARTIGIESIAIEKNIIRAMDENKTVVICDNNVPDLPFAGIGIGRVGIFDSRISLIENQQNVIVETIIDPDTKQVIQIIFNTKNIKIEYRCADVSKIKAPKQIKDTMDSVFMIPKNIVEILVKAQAAMGDDKVTFISNEKGMSFEIVDCSSNDVFSYIFAEQARSLHEDKSNEFVFRYPIKTLIQLLKQEFDQTVEVSVKGILKFNVNNLNTYVIPSI